MNNFSQYLTAIFTAGICAFICETLCLTFKSSKSLCRALNIITSVVLFSVIVFPLCSAVINTRLNTEKYIPQSNTQEPGYEELTSLTVSQIEKNLTVKMFEETGIYPENISINFNDGTEKNEIKSVSVTVSSTLDDDKTVISEYLKKFFGNNIKVEIAEL